MNRRRASPGFRKAYTYLMSVARSGKAQERLPTTMELAAAAGVAKATMSKAVALLKSLNVVRTSPGSGIHVCAADAVPPEQPAPPPDHLPGAAAWERTRAAITEDIMRGVYRPGSHLPSAKQLRAVYGVSHATLRKALAGIECIEIAGRSFRLRSGAFSHAMENGVLVVAETDSLPELLAHGARTLNLWLSLEQECSRNNINVEIMPPDMPRISHALERGLRSSRRVAMVLGMICLAQELTVRQVRRLVEMAEERGVPLVVYDEASRTSDLPGRRTRFLVGLVRHQDDRQAGLELGRYLVIQGHRRIVCFSYETGIDWCESRVCGLREAFAEAGVPNAVEVEHAATFVAWERGRIPGLPDAVERQVEAIVAQGPRSDLQAMAELRQQARNILQMAEHRKRVFEIFARSLADRRASAWVGIRDEMALLILDYLHTQGVRVGTDISVAGFDGTLEAFARGLTTYDFNMPGVAAALLNHVLYRLPISGAPTRKLRPVPGFVVQRATTGVPRRNMGGWSVRPLTCHIAGAAPNAAESSPPIHG